MEFFAELLLEVFGEVLVELAIAVLGEWVSHRTPRPSIAALGSLLFGAGLAALSLWVMPHHLIQSPALRMASLLLSPLAVGFLLGARGWLGKKPAFRGSSFVSGALLAASAGAVRYFFAS